MYKAAQKHAYDTPIAPYRSASPIHPSARNLSPHTNTSSKIDLHKFNDYLQERIGRSARRKEMEMSRQEGSQKKAPYQYNCHQNTPSGSMIGGHGWQNPKESRIKKSREIVSPKGMWRKHESIEKLMEKQNQIVLCQNRGTQSSSQQSALRELQRRYQQLQEKYKTLMKEASENAKQFQKDKKELTKLKEVHQQDQDRLSKLRKELFTLNENMKSVEKPDCQNQQSLIKVKSEVSIGLTYSQPVHQMWKRKLYQEAKIDPSNKMRCSRNKTSENWTKQMSKGNCYQSEQKSRPQQSRYYSAQKAVDQMRRSACKVKKTSDHGQYSNAESKTSIKFQDSTKCSRVGIPSKPVTETLIRFEQQFSKVTTPTTLHKKMITSKPYSKYRFQPSYKMD